jgi:hypothetical protein
MSDFGIPGFWCQAGNQIAWHGLEVYSCEGTGSSPWFWGRS